MKNNKIFNYSTIQFFPGINISEILENSLKLIGFLAVGLK
jgi:hypothetical protein